MTLTTTTTLTLDRLTRLELEAELLELRLEEGDDYTDDAAGQERWAHDCDRLIALVAEVRRLRGEG